MSQSWSVLPLWSLVKESREQVDPTDLGDEVVHFSIPSVDATGTGQLEQTDTIKSAKLRLHGGEVLISKLNPRKSRVLVAQANEKPMVSSTEFVCLTVDDSLETQYLAYLLQSEYVRQDLDSRVQSVTRSHQRVAPEDITHLNVALPDKSEQRRIADFLNAETSRIDRLTAAKERVSSLIDERRIALTSQLCLRGCEPTTAMKDTGIGPLGVVPAHWKVTRNKNFLVEVADLSADGAEELLTVSHLTGVTPRSEKNVYMFLAETMAGYKICQPRDLVINTLWAWMGALGVARHGGIVSPAYGVYRFTSDQILPDYFDLLYRTPEYVCEMTRYSKGVWHSRLRLYPEAFLGLSAPVPPRREQEQIVEAIERELEPGARLQRAIGRSNTLLSERRTALITAAVTGQFDVSTASGRGVTE